MLNRFTSLYSKLPKNAETISETTLSPFYFELDYSRVALKEYAARLSYLPWTMLLDSGDSDHTDSRFDILVANPIITLETELKGESGNQPVTKICCFDYEYTKQSGTENRLGNNHIAHNHQKILINESIEYVDPFDLLDVMLDACPFKAEPEENLPFQGGALGFWSYDLGKTQENLSALAPKIDTLPAMAIGIYDWALIADHQLGKLTLILYADSQPAAEIKQKKIMESIPKSPLKSQCEFKLTQPWQSLITREEYGESFRTIQEALLAGDCYQVNLTQGFTAQYIGNEWLAYETLMQANQAPFSAFMRFAENSILSASPERFISVINRQISTKPIKGTLPKLDDAILNEQQKSHLASSEKNRSENLMIVDLLRNDIGRIAVPGSVRVPKLFDVESFPAVHHLVSTITAELPKNISPAKLLKACFPGGSITGAPKISAMTIIDQLEHSQRSMYCGSIGYISFCGRMDTNIAIRTIIAEAPTTVDERTQNKSGKLFCWAGGGIVAESEEQDEYDESLAKLSKILSLWKI